ncbi:MAG: DUF898 domain-containing protein [Burkholderiales bacterium]|nr:DUF898 domain-containing protein [Burkholderiales bacterium]
MSAGAVMPRTESESPAEEPALEQTQRFEFTGSGGEYFRIWVVNLLATIVTLGVYSAWAKVRRLQYFYRNTRVAGDIFDYHGNPIAILKGRILAVGLLGTYQIAVGISGAFAVIVILLLLAILPWLLARAFRFKLANSSYRGLRFRFHGTVADAYRKLILLPVIVALAGFFVWSLWTSFASRQSIGLYVVGVLLMLAVVGGVVPLAHYLLKRYQHDNGYFGQAPFFFHAKASDFFKVYGKAIGMVIIGMVATTIFTMLTAKLYMSLANSSLGWLFESLYGLLATYLLYLFVRPYLDSRIQNLVWNQTELADHHFESTVSARKLLWIHASNLALIVVTLGLYKPFATVRLIQYRVSCMALVPKGDLEEFLADQTADDAGAAGQEAGDFFDIDIAL